MTIIINLSPDIKYISKFITLPPNNIEPDKITSVFNNITPDNSIKHIIICDNIDLAKYVYSASTSTNQKYTFIATSFFNLQQYEFNKATKLIIILVNSDSDKTSQVAALKFAKRACIKNINIKLVPAHKTCFFDTPTHYSFDDMLKKDHTGKLIANLIQETPLYKSIYINCLIANKKKIQIL